MPLESYICRHCGEEFTPSPGKPGYIDECPECLVARSFPSVQRSDKRPSERKGKSKLQKAFEKAGHPEDRAREWATELEAIDWSDFMKRPTSKK
jgi:hypothetical protein